MSDKEKDNTALAETIKEAASIAEEVEGIVSMADVPDGVTFERKGQHGTDVGAYFRGKIVASLETKWVRYWAIEGGAYRLRLAVKKRGQYNRDTRHYKRRKDGTINVERAAEVLVEFAVERADGIRSELKRREKTDNWMRWAKDEFGDDPNFELVGRGREIRFRGKEWTFTVKDRTASGKDMSGYLTVSGGLTPASVRLLMTSVAKLGLDID